MTGAEDVHSSDEPSAVFDALSHSRRRRTLHVLEDVATSLTLVGLAREIIRSKRGEPTQGIGNAQTTWVQTTLYHFHVPELVDAGLVEFDRNRTRVAIADSAALTRWESGLSSVSLSD